MRERGIDPDGRRITMDNAAAVEAWLVENEIPFTTVPISIGGTD
jgi:hypothetical protein